MERSALLFRVLRPEPFLAGAAFLTGDLIDKPLWVAGVVTDGRFIGHTLLVLVLMALASSAIRWHYGLFVLIGGGAHLAMDRNGFLPFFYPFKSYVFPTVNYHRIITWDCIAATIIEMAMIVLAVALVLFVVVAVIWGIRRFTR